MRSKSRMKIAALFLMLLPAAGGAWAASARDYDPLVSPVLLREAGLRQDWQFQLPIKPGESLERLFVFDRYLLVLTDRNYLFCLNRPDGSYRFGMRLTEERLPVCDPMFMDDKVFFLIGRMLKVIDPAAGAMTRTAVLTAMDDNSKCSIGKNEEFVYVAGVDRRVHAFQITPTDYIHLFMATSDDDSAISSLTATPERVYFTTQSGNVIAMQPDRPVRVWQYNASGPIQAAMVLDDQDIYVGSVDTKLYKIDAERGRLQWPTPFYTGDKILQSPTVGETVVYQVAGKSGLYAVDKQTGQAVWNIPSGRSLLCESGPSAYTFAVPGVLMVMDNAAGRERYSLNMAQVTRYAVNTVDANMYVADAQGRVAAIAVP